MLINLSEPTNLSCLGAYDAVIERIELQGKGKLGSCMLTFSKNGDQPVQQKDVLFIKGLHQSAEVLYPHLKNFSLAEFDYCMLEVFTGNMLPDDHIVLYLRLTA